MMNGKHCKLFDENLVHNIMISTGLSVFDFIRSNPNIQTEQIFEYIDMNASSIIDETIDHLNRDDDDDDAPWLSGSDGGPDY